VSNPDTTFIQLPAAVANGISTSQTPGGAGNLTITGSLATGGVANLVVARRVIITSSGVDSARVFTVFGTDRNGNPISEVVTGVTTTPVMTFRDFLTVTRISVDAATAGAITAGTNGTGSTEWIVLNFLCVSWSLGGGVTAPAGTTYFIEVTFDDVNKIGTSLVATPQQFSMEALSFVPPKAWPTSAAALTLDQFLTFTTNPQPLFPIFAIRVTVVSGTGLVVMQTIQSGL
jgi:hypothetical protein